MFGPKQSDEQERDISEQSPEQPPEIRLPVLRTWRVKRGVWERPVLKSTETIVSAHMVVLDRGHLTFFMFKPDLGVQGIPQIPVRGFAYYDEFEEITPLVETSSILV